ncbi:hypothetical protein CC2G_011394 [Coprinopsis cinerea AmutBmut pab1-1]|nr:hypothetical protein CC2G_011394 [Coprinopsis cinerea AmutBmut pab1-1]
MMSSPANSSQHHLDELSSKLWGIWVDILGLPPAEAGAHWIFLSGVAKRPIDGRFQRGHGPPCGNFFFGSWELRAFIQLNMHAVFGPDHSNCITQAPVFSGLTAYVCRKERRWKRFHLILFESLWERLSSVFEIAFRGRGKYIGNISPCVRLVLVLSTKITSMNHASLPLGSLLRSYIWLSRRASPTSRRSGPGRSNVYRDLNIDPRENEPEAQENLKVSKSLCSF